MQRQFTKAGGVFIAAGAIGGFLYGATLGEALKWALAGTLAGIAVAILLWMIDRRR